MFRRWFLAAALLLTPAQAGTYGGLSFETPRGWAFDGSNPAAAVFRRLDDPAGQKVVMLMVPPSPVGGAPDQWFERVTGELSSDGPGEVLEPARWVDVRGGGRQAVQVRRVRLGGGPQLRLYAGVVVEGRGVVFVLVAPSAQALRDASDDFSALSLSALPSLRAGTGRAAQASVPSGPARNGAASGTLGRALAQGYARGEQAVVYRSASWQMLPNYGAGGVALIPGLVVETAAFLPGGVFLAGPGEPDFRTPDLREAGTWKKGAQGYEVTLADGEQRVYRTGTAPGTVVLGGTTLTLVPRLTPAQVGGTFEAGRSFSSGGGGLAAVFSQSSLKLHLQADGMYRLDGSSQTQGSGSGGTVSTGSQNTERGTWTFDPASYTLTLKAENGTVRRGACYPLTPFRGMGKGEVSWHLLGDDGWLSF